MSVLHPPADNYTTVRFYFIDFFFKALINFKRFQQNKYFCLNQIETHKNFIPFHSFTRTTSIWLLRNKPKQTRINRNLKSPDLLPPPPYLSYLILFEWWKIIIGIVRSVVFWNVSVQIIRWRINRLGVEALFQDVIAFAFFRVSVPCSGCRVAMKPHEVVCAVF